tara:strand:- start:7398 stop:7769 length:372 start_codon:yes stop_codon:yes gene_type:complete
MSLLNDNSLPHLVDIEQTAYTRDDMGGQVVTYTRVKDNVRAWVQPVFGMEQKEFDQQSFKVTHKVYFSENPKMGDDVNRIVWHPIGGERHLLEFVSERDAGAGLGRLHRVNCEELSNRPEEDD